MSYPILIDMDCILVDMLPSWIARYNEITGENVQVSDITDYDVGLFCKQQDVLYKILDEPGFFYRMDPMPGALEYFQKLIDSKRDIVIVTQPPRKVDLAVRDKRRWIKKYFPSFELMNMIFCHRKELVQGSVLLDDKPAHLKHWKEFNPEGRTATIDWAFNRHIETDFRGSTENGWREFYHWIEETF